MSNRYIISETEKERILGLHEQASLTPNDIINTLTSMGVNDPSILAFVPKAKELITTTKIFGESPDLSKLTVDGIIKALQPYITTDQQTVELIKKGLTALRPDLKLPITPVSSAPVASQPIQLGVENPKVKEIQNLLNGPKYNAKLVPDGKWGPKTATALQKAIAAKKSAVVTPADVGDVSGTVATQTTVS